SQDLSRSGSLQKETLYACAWTRVDRRPGLSVERLSVELLGGEFCPRAAIGSSRCRARSRFAMETAFAPGRDDLRRHGAWLHAAGYDHRSSDSGFDPGGRITGRSCARFEREDRVQAWFRKRLSARKARP